MNAYIVTREFSAPQVGVRLFVGTAVGKIGARVDILIGGIEYSNKAFYDWIGTADSLHYLAFVGVLPDPPTPGGDVACGTFPIPALADEVTVAGAAFGFLPTCVVAIVWKPAPPGSNIFATIRMATVTADGFVADLSGPTPGPGYLLSYAATA